MAQDIRTLTGETADVAEKRRGFHPFAAMAESIRNARARRSTIELFEAAMRFGERENIDEALASYIALPQKPKEQSLLHLQEALKRCSSLPFEDAAKTQRVTVIAELFAGAARMLPVDSEGERITAPYRDAIKAFRDIVEHDDLRLSGKEEHSGAILACVAALWELEYGSFKFWDARAHDSATQDYTITKLLEMPGSPDTDEHGWSLLRKDLAELGIAIAGNPSPKTEAFFRSMLFDGDKDVAKAALKGALYFGRIPEEFFDIAGDLTKVSGLESAAQNFIAAGHLKMLLEVEGENKMMALRQLASMYSRGMGHLAPMLKQTGREITESALAADDNLENRRRQLDALVYLASAGIMPYDGETLKRLLTPLLGSQGAAGAFYNLTGIILMKCEDAGLHKAVTQMESDRVNACIASLECADGKQFESSMELVRLLATGRDYLLKNGIIAHVMSEMVDVVSEPAGASEEEQNEQRRKAVGVLSELGKLGISVTLTTSSPDGVFTEAETRKAHELQELFDKFSPKAQGAPAGPTEGPTEG
jgi:hypothetical protein